METETTAVVEKPVKVKRNSPTDVVFAQTWNASDSRNAVVAKLIELGYHATYSAVVARAKAYKESGVNLKEMPNAPKGRQRNVAAINTALAGG